MAQVTVNDLVEKYILGGKAVVEAALKENPSKKEADLTLTDLKMDSLDIVQLAVKVQDDLKITLSDDEFAKVPAGDSKTEFKPVDAVTLGDIAGIINSKVK